MILCVFEARHHPWWFVWTLSWCSWSRLSFRYIITYPWVMWSHRVLRLAFLTPTGSIVVPQCGKGRALVRKTCRWSIVLNRRVLSILLSYPVQLFLCLIVASLLLLEAAISDTTPAPFDVGTKLRFAAATSCSALRRVADYTLLLRHSSLCTDLFILLFIDLSQVLDFILQ